MTMMKWPSYIYLFFILFTCQFDYLDSIQCCRDYECTEQNIVDCPSNVCFKLSFNVPPKITIERGCMSDLMDLVNADASTDDNGDSCQTSGDNNNNSGSTICKCTTNRCNSSTKLSTSSFNPVFIFILILNLLNKHR